MNKTGRTAVIVGIMVIFSIALFIGSLSILAKWKLTQKGFYINVQYKFLNNISVRAPVRISGGINIGYVSRIYRKGLKSFVKLYINEDLINKIPKKPETQFAIFTTGLMGQKYINIVIPEIKKGDIFYQNGDITRGIDPPSMDQMMMSFSNWFDGQKGGQVLADIMRETRFFISNLNAIASENRKDIRDTIVLAKNSFTNLTKQLDKLMLKLNLLTTDFADITRKNKQDIKIILHNMAKISKDMNLVTKRIYTGRGTMGKFVMDDELYNNANEAMKYAKDLMHILYEKPWLIILQK